MKQAALAAMILVTLFALVFPLIQTSRRSFRSDPTTSALEVTRIPYAYLSTSLLEVASGLWDPTVEQSGNRIDFGASASEFALRISAWSAYSSSIVRRVSEGYPPQGISAALRSFMLVVPGGGGSVDADEDVYRHFDIGRPGLDASGSTVADVFSQLHVFGVVLVFGGVGFAIGAFARFVARYGDRGALLLVAGLPAMLPLGDSSAVYLAGVRNYLFVATAMLLIGVAVDRRHASPTGFALESSGSKQIPGGYENS